MGESFIVADTLVRRRFWFESAEKGKQTVDAELGIHVAEEAF